MTQTYLPSFCQKCQHRVVNEAGYGPLHPWRAALVVVQIALFQVAAGHPTVQGRCGPAEDGTRDAQDLTVVLAEIGCLGCFLPRALTATIVELRDKGMDHLARETQDAARMQVRVERLVAAELRP